MQFWFSGLELVHLLGKNLKIVDFFVKNLGFLNLIEYIVLRFI